MPHSCNVGQLLAAWASVIKHKTTAEPVPRESGDRGEPEQRKNFNKLKSSAEESVRRRLCLARRKGAAGWRFAVERGFAIPDFAVRVKTELGDRVSSIVSQLDG